jgi:hypothetical protein
VEPAIHLVCYARNADAGQLRRYIGRERPFSCPGRPPLNKRLVANILITRRLPGLFANRGLISELATAARLPAMYAYPEFVSSGGLMAYGIKLSEAYRGAAGQIDQILRGTKPGEIPYQQATKFLFAINLKTAKTLGLEIPPNVLARADEVIE